MKSQTAQPGFHPRRMARSILARVEPPARLWRIRKRLDIGASIRGTIATGGEFALCPLANFVEIEKDFSRAKFEVRHPVGHVAVNASAAAKQHRLHVGLVAERLRCGGGVCAELGNRRRVGLR